MTFGAIRVVLFFALSSVASATSQCGVSDLLITDFNYGTGNPITTNELGYSQSDDGSLDGYTNIVGQEGATFDLPTSGGYWYTNLASSSTSCYSIKDYSHIELDLSATATGIEFDVEVQTKEGTSGLCDGTTDRSAQTRITIGQTTRHRILVPLTTLQVVSGNYGFVDQVKAIALTFENNQGGADVTIYTIRLVNPDQVINDFNSYSDRNSNHLGQWQDDDGTLRGDGMNTNNDGIKFELPTSDNSGYWYSGVKQGSVCLDVTPYTHFMLDLESDADGVSFDIIMKYQVGCAGSSISNAKVSHTIEGTFRQVTSHALSDFAHAAGSDDFKTGLKTIVFDFNTNKGGANLILRKLAFYSCGTDPNPPVPLQTFPSCRVLGPSDQVPVYPSPRGLYVSPYTTGTHHTDYDQIMESSWKTDKLLNFVVDQSINSVSLYNLNKVQDDSKWSTLGDLMVELRNCGVTEIFGIGGSTGNFDDIKTYQDTASGSDSQFDGVLTEYEFWNTGYSYSTYVSILNHLGTINIQKNSQSIKIATYIGWPSGNLEGSETEQGRTDEIAQKCDVVFVHAYRTDIDSCFGYTSGRLDKFRLSPSNVEVRPIYSAEGTLAYAGNGQPFMGDWFKDHEPGALTTAGDKYGADYEADYGTGPSNVILNGIQVFNYRYLDTHIG